MSKFQNGNRTNSQARIQIKINLHNQGKKAVNVNGEMDIVKTTLSTSFT